MKKYVFITCDITLLGGIQAYLAGKSKYLIDTGWQVSVFYYSQKNKSCVFPSLDRFRNGNIAELFYLPNRLNKTIIKHTINKMKKAIDYQLGDTVYVESHYDKVAIWGELFAEATLGKHVCLCCNEVFFGKGKYYKDYLDFFKYKYERNEMAFISEKFAGALFGKSYSCTDNVETFFAATDDPVQDVVDSRVECIECKDYNIAYIGRANKEGVEYIINGVKRFAETNSGSVNFTFVGDASEEDIARIKKCLRCNENLSLTFTGSLVPIPRRLFSKIDVVIAGSGCARLAAQEGVFTIVVDANDFMSNGVLGIDTQNTLFREEGKLCENIDETLKRVLVKKSYDRNNILVLKRRNNNNCYQEQLQYFKNADGKYYSSVILCYPKERIVISHIRLVGLLLNGRFRRMCISE